MKPYFLFLTLLIFSSGCVYGKIRNGYECQIQGAEVSLKSLNALLTEHKNLPAIQRRKIKSAIFSLIVYITYYDLTEKLLEQFATISPELFKEMDTIRDYKGRPVDIYIKFIPRDQAVTQRPGTTLFAQGVNDSEAHHSEYGDGSISVKIWAMDNALFILSHEFGHIHYIAPNLASYIQYYKANYRPDNKTDYVGHSASDPSGKSATSFQQRFSNDYRSHLRNGGTRLKIENILYQMSRQKVNSESNTSSKLLELTHTIK